MLGTVGLFGSTSSIAAASLVRYRAPLVGPRADPRSGLGVIRYGFSVMGLHRIEAGVLPGNDASVRVLQKLGFVEEGSRRE